MAGCPKELDIVAAVMRGRYRSFGLKIWEIMWIVDVISYRCRHKM